MSNCRRTQKPAFFTVESDRSVEDRILNLIDNYLASDLRYLGEEIRAYERH